MNKPAPREPSMDEILSSIRQIIADDDAGAAPRRPALQAAPEPMQPAPAAPRAVATEAQPPRSAFADVLDEIEPLALKADQIVSEPETPAAQVLSFEDILADTEGEAEGAQDDDPVGLVDPDDIGFDAEPEEAKAFVADTIAEVPPEKPEPVVTRAAPRVEMPRMAAASVAPMPDQTLSSDMAEQLLEPATNAAVRNTFAKLNNLGVGAQGLTIEAMIRDMLRPMLKEWLDENLPTVVERMVEKEIARISRGE